jgi:hypothetical protein
MKEQSGIFIGVRVEYNSRQRLIDFCGDNNIDIQLITAFDRRMHSSIIYSPEINQEMMNLKQKKFKVKAKEWKVFESQVSGMKSLALKIEGDDLNTYHHSLKHFGLRHRFESYSPHISLAYDFKGDSPVVLPEFDIVLEDIYIKEFHLKAPGKDFTDQVLKLKNYSLEKFELHERIEEIRAGKKNVNEQTSTTNNTIKF